RMLGSSASVATPNIVLNTAVAEALAQFYQELEGTKPEDMEHAVHELLKRAIRKHKKIIFNGNGYSEEWVKEAESRGLYNLISTPDCLPQFIVEKNVDLFTKHHIFTKDEIFSRYEILLENYVKTILIEARTLSEMLTKDFLPAVSAFAGQTAKNAASKKAFLPTLSMPAEEALVTKLTKTYTDLTDGLTQLADLVREAESIDDMQKAAEFCHTQILSRMEALRLTANAAETLIPDTLLPYPTYDQLLFSL
ncbi:MAG: glutamine synthetase type III, partial [Lachnospiraceae bacterium]|nr:glutamine synthetase type III [Lachnospiraceae bacterium]